MESKYILTYTNQINVKKLSKSIEENSSNYYKELIKRQKKKINKQNTETIGVEHNLRAKVYLLLIYEAQKNYKKNMKIETDIINHISQLISHYNWQFRTAIANKPELVCQYLHLVIRLEELKQINDMVFLRRLLIVMQEDKQQVVGKVLEYYRKNKESGED